MDNLAFIISLSATTLLCGLTLAPLCRFEAWWIRGMDFPRFQFACLWLVVLIAECLFLDLSLWTSRCLIFVGSACLAYHGWWIYPYTPLHATEVADSDTTPVSDQIRIMTANVYTPNRRADLLFEHIKQYQPDVLVTLESDAWWEQQLDTLIDDYPHTIKCPLDNTYGMHVYSRCKLVNPSIEYLVEDDVPSMHTLLTLASGQSVQCHFLHPAPPSPTQNSTSSERDAELIAVAKRVAESTTPVIVTGDLNDVAWSETTRLFRKISGLLDPRIGRGLFNTFNAKYWFIRWPLDHLFHSGHFTLCDIRRLTAFGSDHFVLFAELAIQDEGNTQDSDLDTTHQDMQTADQKLRNENISKDDVPEPSESNGT